MDRCLKHQSTCTPQTPFDFLVTHKRPQFPHDYPSDYTTHCNVSLFLVVHGCSVSCVSGKCRCASMVYSVGLTKKSSCTQFSVPGSTGPKLKLVEGSMSTCKPSPWPFKCNCFPEQLAIDQIHCDGNVFECLEGFVKEAVWHRSMVRYHLKKHHLG